MATTAQVGSGLKTRSQPGPAELHWHIAWAWTTSWSSRPQDISQHVAELRIRSSDDEQGVLRQPLWTSTKVRTPAQDTTESIVVSRPGHLSTWIAGVLGGSAEIWERRLRAFCLGPPDAWSSAKRSGQGKLRAESTFGYRPSKTAGRGVTLKRRRGHVCPLSALRRLSHHELVVASGAIHPALIPTCLERVEHGVSQDRRVV
jgi:hypothetical protein